MTTMLFDKVEMACDAQLSEELCRTFCTKALDCLAPIKYSYM